MYMELHLPKITWQEINLTKLILQSFAPGPYRPQYKGHIIMTYIRGGQTFLLKGQIWILSITVLRALIFLITDVTHEVTAVQNFFGAICALFVHFWWLYREKLDIFKYLNITFIFAMFLSNDKKVQGPQKQVSGPQFGNAWCIR